VTALSFLGDCRFTNAPEQAITTGGARGSLFYQGRYYDNILSRRRGVTALSWKKPKIKFELADKVCMGGGESVP
jgi:hypothetical protein